MPVVEGSEACDWEGSGENTVCRIVRPLRTTAALEYPLLMRAQGWREVHPGHGAPLGEEFFKGDVLWFERPIDASCAERASMQMHPPPPPPHPDSPHAATYRGGSLIIIQSDYEPVCGAERQAQ